MYAWSTYSATAVVWGALEGAESPGCRAGHLDWNPSWELCGLRLVILPALQTLIIRKSNARFL